MDDDLSLSLVGFDDSGDAYPFAPVGRLRGATEVAPVTAPYDSREELSGMGPVKIEEGRLSFRSTRKRGACHGPAHRGFWPT